MTASVGVRGIEADGLPEFGNGLRWHLHAQECLGQPVTVFGVSRFVPDRRAVLSNGALVVARVVAPLPPVVGGSGLRAGAVDSHESYSQQDQRGQRQPVGLGEFVAQDSHPTNVGQNAHPDKRTLSEGLA